MKKHFLLLTLCLVAITQAFAYTTVTVQDSISTNTHWTCNNQYLIKGWVYVTDGATLTIDAGTIIKGDHDSKGALIVERGAKIYANGTETAPIIMTSNETPGNRNYGDWGGLMICGKANVNWNGNDHIVEGGPRSHYGGTNDADNSGSLTYVRIEFGGIPLTPNNEINGLTLCGVGSGTTIDHVQVSYSGDDSYEWFGGAVNAKHLISYKCWDDDFDNDNGWQGKVQFGIILRDPNIGDLSGSKGFESDSYQSGTDTLRLTKPVFSNITAVGPLVNQTTTQYADNIRAGVHIRRGSAMTLVNSILGAWPCAVLLDEAAVAYTTTSGNIGTDELQFRHNIIAGTGTQAGFPRDILYVKDGARSLTAITANADTTNTITPTPAAQFAPFAGPWDFLTSATNGNKVYSGNFQNNVGLVNPFGSAGNPNFAPLPTSPVCYNSNVAHPFNPMNPINPDTSNNYANYNMPNVAPDFTNNKASDAWFDHVNYVGAIPGTQISADDWSKKAWVEWNPQDANYDYVCPLGVTNVNNYVETAHAYPNPASQNAMITYNTIADGNVQVAIVDVTGKVVANLFNGTQAKGEHNFNVDLHNFAEGIYVVTVKTNNSVKTLKLSVIK